MLRREEKVAGKVADQRKPGAFHLQSTDGTFFFFPLFIRARTLKQTGRRKPLSQLFLSLRRNDLLNEQLAPGARINVSIVAFTTCLFFFLLAQRHLYNDDNRD